MVQRLQDRIVQAGSEIVKQPAVRRKIEFRAEAILKGLYGDIDLEIFVLRLRVGADVDDRLIQHEGRKVEIPDLALDLRQLFQADRFLGRRFRGIAAALVAQPFDEPDDVHEIERQLHDRIERVFLIRVWPRHFCPGQHKLFDLLTRFRDGRKLDALVEDQHILVRQIEYLQISRIVRDGLYSPLDLQDIAVVLVLKQRQVQMDQPQSLQFTLGGLQKLQQPFVI